MTPETEKLLRLAQHAKDMGNDTEAECYRKQARDTMKTTVHIYRGSTLFAVYLLRCGYNFEARFMGEDYYIFTFLGITKEAQSDLVIFLKNNYQDIHQYETF